MLTETYVQEFNEMGDIAPYTIAGEPKFLNIEHKGKLILGGFKPIKMQIARGSWEKDIIPHTTDTDFFRPSYKAEFRELWSKMDDSFCANYSQILRGQCRGWTLYQVEFYGDKLCLCFTARGTRLHPFVDIRLDDNCSFDLMFKTSSNLLGPGSRYLFEVKPDGITIRETRDYNHRELKIDPSKYNSDGFTAYVTRTTND